MKADDADVIDPVVLGQRSALFVSSQHLSKVKACVKCFEAMSRFITFHSTYEGPEPCSWINRPRAARELNPYAVTDLTPGTCSPQM